MALFAIYLATIINRSCANEIVHIVEEETEVELPTDPVAFFNQSPKEGLVEALDYYGIQYPEIVYAQALLETGHFKSKLCTQYNNLFGLYNSRTKSYYRFDNWWDSVIAYRDKVQYKYKGNTDYYTFLVKLPYATDPDYIRKIKQLEYRYWTYINKPKRD
ncbi:MAG: glucosaminidase domain-containing protein [Lachnospiraceae bacterium]|nr:glucosaminidase domain-containing protein [Lachnospiraceae bacterium]